MLAQQSAFRIMPWFLVPLLYILRSSIPTSIDDQANHIKRKSNLIFGEAAITGLWKRKDERDIFSELGSEKQKDDRQKAGLVLKNIDNFTDFPQEKLLKEEKTKTFIDTVDKVRPVTKIIHHHHPPTHLNSTLLLLTWS